MSLLPGAGPTGQTAVQFDQLPASSHAQYYLGWTTNAGNPTQGSVRYVRVRFKALTPIAMSGNDGSWGNKFIIIGDGDNPTGRVMCILRDNGISENTMAIQCSRNIDGAPNNTSLVTLSGGVWHSLQLEMRSSTTTSSADGRLKLWLDGANSNYASPTSQSGAFQLNAINWANVNIGYYAGTTIRAGSHVSYQIADFEWDDAFDSGYHAGTPGGLAVPEAPTAVRVIRAAMDVLPLSVLGFAALGMLIQRSSARRN